MSNLNSQFNVQYGWKSAEEDGATITVNFPPAAAVTATSQLLEGEWVSLGSDGTVNRFTGADFAAAGSVAALAAAIAQAKQPWMVLGGAGQLDYDAHSQAGAPVNGRMTWVSSTVSCIRGTFVVKTSEYVVRDYVPGNSLTCIAGKLDLTSGAINPGYQPVAEVKQYDAAAGFLIASVRN